MTLEPHYHHVGMLHVEYSHRSGLMMVSFAINQGGAGGFESASTIRFASFAPHELKLDGIQPASSHMNSSEALYTLMT